MARKVLIVEDDSNIAELLHLYLEKEGFETAVAGDGGKGVELFRSFHPELVLLDITASSDARDIMVDIVTRVAESIFIPFTVGAASAPWRTSPASSGPGRTRSPSTLPR